MKKIKNITILIVLIFLLISMIIQSNITINSVISSLNICIYNLFPSMIPFFIISELLVNYGFVEVMAYFLHPIMKYLFHLNENCAYVIILSMLSGTPANAKYIKELLDNKKITLKDANKIVLFSHFANPIFIIGTVGEMFLGDKKLGIIILISGYITNLIVGIFLRNEHVPNNKNISLKNVFESSNKNFISVLKSAILNTIKSIVIVFGTITSCIIFSNILNSYFKFNPLLNGILEITSGLNFIGVTNIKIIFKIMLSSFYLNFGGFAIHAQVFSILDNKKIRYLPYLEARIISGILSASISILIYIFI